MDGHHPTYPSYPNGFPRGDTTRAPPYKTMENSSPFDLEDLEYPSHITSIIITTTTITSRSIPSTPNDHIVRARNAHHDYP